MPQTRHQGSPFLSELKQRLLLPQNEAAQAGTRYNVPLINSLVLYVGMQVIFPNMCMHAYIYLKRKRLRNFPRKYYSTYV